MNLSETIRLYRAIARNQRLQQRRHPMFEKNMAMKVFSYIMVAFWAAYFMFFGWMFYVIFDGGAIEAFDMIDGGMIFFLAIDFFMRFAMQETPAQDVKPYKLLPVSSSFLVNVFLLRQGLSIYNMFWAFFFVPFSLFAVVKFYGFLGMASYLFGWWLMFILNGYLYLMCRTLVNRWMPAIVLPVAAFAALIYFGIFYDEHLQWLFYATVWLGRLFTTLNPLYILLFLVAVVPLFLVNSIQQKASIYREISKTEVVKSVKSREFSFFNRFGVIGEYLKLEIRSTMRNAVVRKQFVTAIVCQLLLCALYSFSDVYDSMPFMQVYICVYNFACLSVMTLTGVMCAEGNYIDGLMSRHESIYSLLLAKYYFNCSLQILPLVISLMPIIEGKMTVDFAFACMFFTTGVIMPFLFQLAVYNDMTIRLNEKLTKSGRSTKEQMIFSSAALFVPMMVMYVLMNLWNAHVAAWLMIFIGLAGTCAHRYWLRNIYNRFMKRRHKNMAGFRDSRL